MASTTFDESGYGPFRLHEVETFDLHPGPTCFTTPAPASKASKLIGEAGGEARIFRLDAHVARMRQSAALMCLPVPDEELVIEMVETVVDANRQSIPEPPGSLYLRPTLIGTEVNIGAAGSPPKNRESSTFWPRRSATISPAGCGPLRILIEDEDRRSTPGFGMVKAGANYVSALRTVVAARRDHQADQVLFAPDGLVEETGRLELPSHRRRRRGDRPALGFLSPRRHP